MVSSTATEPAWLAGARDAARATYETLPVPTNREEAWRFTNLRGFVEPIARELPMEYALELNRLIELQMEGAVG